MDIFVRDPATKHSLLIPTDTTSGRHEFQTCAFRYDLDIFAGDDTAFCRSFGLVCLRAIIDHLLPRIVTDFSGPVTDGPTLAVHIDHEAEDPSVRIRAVLSIHFDENPVVAQETAMAAVAKLHRHLQDTLGGVSHVSIKRKRGLAFPSVPEGSYCCAGCRRWFFPTGLRTEAHRLAVRAGMCCHENDAAVTVPGGR